MRDIPLLHRHGHTPDRLAGTARFEAFSDGVIAILITLLILEVHIPQISGLGSEAVWAEIVHTLPQLASFAISFALIAIFWVNHYHFTHHLTHVDYKLLWYNNFVLFWLALVPFTTAFLGENHLQAVALSVYAFVLFMACSSFMLMTRYVVKAKLSSTELTDVMKTRTNRRSMFGVVLYGAATLLAFVSPHAVLAIFVIVPLAYFAPATIGKEV